jgi:hypothetical protein
MLDKLIYFMSRATSIERTLRSVPLEKNYAKCSHKEHSYHHTLCREYPQRELQLITNGISVMPHLPRASAATWVHVDRPTHKLQH